MELETAAVLSDLRCPQCLSGALTPAVAAAGAALPAAFRCTACAASFPSVGGVPWLLAEPRARLADWRQRHHLLARELEEGSRLAAEALAMPGLPAPTRERLARRRDAFIEQVRLVGDLLAPLDLSAPLARYETHLALRTRLPPEQDLHSYHANLFRDWCWGGEENEAAFRFVDSLFAGRPPGRVLVPGAGACRLAFDVHERLAPSVTVALDINPMLLLAASALTSGRGVTLYEFPIAPRRGADAALRRSLEPVRGARAGLQLVFGDVSRAPFVPGSFDTVLTAWLVDIVPQPLADLASQVNELLAVGGRWINFGSLAFGQHDAAQRHGPEEIAPVLETAGFGDVASAESELPYMRSAASRHARHELVFGFSAGKRRDVPVARESAVLPAWLADVRQPVPMLDAFRSTALAHRICAFVASLVDGRRSIAEMAAALVEQQLMRPDEAVAAVRGFLLQLYDEARSRRGPGA